MEQDITLSMTVTKQNGKIFSDHTNTYGGLDDQAIAWFIRAATEMNTHWDKSKGAQGKSYSVKLSGKIVGEDGSVAAAPMDGKTTATYTGVPYNAIHEGNKKLIKYAQELEKMAEQQLKTKHANDHAKK